MSDTINVKINGKNCEAKKGEYLLETAHRNMVPIPSLCHHDALSGLGCCRLCVVEVNEDGKNRVVVSCVYPLTKDCEVFTETEKIKGIRRTILSMLRGRAPKGELISTLCQIYGVQEEKRYSSPGAAEKERGRMHTACTLCGLCAEACSRLGTGAISTTGRGTGKKISTPFEEPSADCIGCASCAAVCSTGAIEYTQDKGSRTIWGKSFDLAACKKCGKLFATKEELEHSAKRLKQQCGDDAACEPVVLCEDCRKKKSGDVMAKTFAPGYAPRKQTLKGK